MFKIRQKTIFPLCTLALAILWIYLGVTRYGFWSAKSGPGIGFFPILVASVLALFSLVAIYRSSTEEPAVYDKEVLHLLAAIIGVLVSTYLFGLLYSLLVYVVLWMKFYEKLTLRTTVIATIVMIIIVYGTFVWWLQVPFPEGVVFERPEM